MSKYLFLVLLLLSASAPAAIEPLLGFDLPDNGAYDYLVCTIPEEDGDAACVLHEKARHMSCTYDFNKKIMRCTRGGPAI